jgi:pilus assembly protein Flp/PilA
MATLKKLLQDQIGVTAIEYALIGAIIAIAAIVSLTSIGNTISTTFSTVASKL